MRFYRGLFHRCSSGLPVLQRRDGIAEPIGAQVRVAERHAERPMPEDFLNLLEAAAAHDQSGRARVPEVVKPEVGDLRGGAGALERGADAASRRPVPPSEHRLLGLLPGYRGEDVVHRLIHRDLAPATAVRVLDLEHPAGEIDALPRQAENLPAAHPGVQRDRHDGPQVRILRPLAGVEEPHGVGFGQVAESALRLLRQSDGGALSM